MQPNQFERLELLIGNENLKRLNNSKVLVVGIGGVGGYVVESLARSGIGNITIVDNDVVDITNLNRQIIALHSTIGRKKVDIMEERIRNINNNCNVTKYDIFLSKDNYEKLFTNDYDFIVDCCDSIETKKILLEIAINKNTKYIASMGTANKMDPFKLEIIELKKTINDPIARIMRKYVRDNKIKEKIMVLSSKELPIKNKNKLGSNSFVPPTAGLLISSYIVNNLIDINLQNI